MLAVEIIIIIIMKQQRKQEKFQSKFNKSNPKGRQGSMSSEPKAKIENSKSAEKVTKVYSKKSNDELPTIQNMLEIKPQDRTAKTGEYFKKVKTFLHTYLLKKIGSRVIQLMFKWGDQEVKTTIYKSILQHWKDLIKSKYALHTISKVSAEFQFPRLVEDAIHLQNNKEGSMVLENFLNKHQGTEKANQIIKKFEEIEKLKEEKGFESQEPLHNLAMKSIEKEYSHHKISKLIIKLALPTMVVEEQAKIIEYFAEKALDLLVDDEGVKLFVLLYNFFDSKQKKNIIKQVKGRVNDLISLSRMSYVGLIKILTETDDTVSLGNKIVPEILENLGDIKNNHSKIYHILISLLSPRSNNFNCLGKVEKEVPVSGCKKPQETRKQEIRSFLYEPLLDYLTNQENILATCTGANESRLALGVIKSMQAGTFFIIQTLLNI